MSNFYKLSLRFGFREGSLDNNPKITAADPKAPASTGEEQPQDGNQEVRHLGTLEDGDVQAVDDQSLSRDLERLQAMAQEMCCTRVRYHSH